MMRAAYLIDPFERSVRQVFITGAVDSGDELAEIYALLHTSDVEQVTPHKAGSDVMLLDERGKVRETEQAYFQCSLYPHATLAGRALWVGITRDGSVCEPSCALEFVRDHVIWDADASEL
jgi:hypothetical protein